VTIKNPTSTRIRFFIKPSLQPGVYAKQSEV
jgi:hypothetical protein